MQLLATRRRWSALWRLDQYHSLVARQTPLVTALALALLVVLFFFRLGATDLVSSHEARAAQNAQRMLDTGEWRLPTLFDGQPDLQKPPGYYWMVAVVGYGNGGRVTPWVARFPAAVCAWLSVLLVYLFVRRAGYRTGGLVAACVLATANHFVAIGRTARIDIPLTCFITIALITCYVGAKTAAIAPTVRRPFVLSALATGCAVLLKGPVALVLIGSVLGLWLLLEHLGAFAGERPRLPLVSAMQGVLIVVMVAAPWFVWANHITGGEFGRVFFWHHNAERFAGSSAALAVHPWWYYIPRFALAFLPWTLPLHCLTIWALRTGWWRHSPLFRFGTVWYCGMVVVLSLAQFKRADYLLPAFPGAAVAFGSAAEHWLMTRQNPRTVRRAQWAFGVLLTGGLAVWPVMWFVVQPAATAQHEKKPFADVIRRHAPRPQPVVLFRAEAHLLTFHLGPPVYTLVEWSELRAVLSRPGPHVVVMPPEYAAEAERFTNRKWVVIADLANYTAACPPRPLVCLHTVD